MSPFRRAVLTVAILNAAYFVVEFAVAVLIGSVSLFADSVDFLEDTLINLLIFAAVLWPAHRRAVVGRVLAFVILVPAIATIATAIVKILHPGAPSVVGLSLGALGALAVNLTAAFVLARHRHHEGSLSKAAWLSARNDSLANLAIIVAAVVTIWWPTGWPDIIVGIGIGILNADAARAVWRAAGRERLDPDAAEP